MTASPRLLAVDDLPVVRGVLAKSLGARGAKITLHLVSDNAAAGDVFPGVKIRCENWYWSRRLQLLLAAELGCRWPNVEKMPWNVHRPYLVVQQSSFNRRWYLGWASDADFEKCPLPEYTAKGLVHAHAALD